MQKQYYRLLCLQNGNYMATGYNATSKEELRQDILGYIENDTDEEDFKLWQKSTLNDLCEAWSFEVESSSTKYKEQEL